MPGLHFMIFAKAVLKALSERYRIAVAIASRLSSSAYNSSQAIFLRFQVAQACQRDASVPQARSKERSTFIYFRARVFDLIALELPRGRSVWNFNG